jgi:choline dehydrogenase-like flavoprotein
LAELRFNPKLSYRPGALVSHLSLTNGEEVEAAVLSGGDGQERISADLFVLAAGTIPTAGIFLRSYWARDGDAPVLRGLMDNRQVLLPIINLAMLGRPYSPESYQYHQLALGLNTERAFDYVHGQVTMLTTATAHPVIKQLPFGLSPARAIFAELRSALGIVNLNFSDTRRPENRLFLDPEKRTEDGWPILRIKYDPPAGEKGKISDAIRRTRRLMRELRAPCIPGMAQVRPMGSSVHYAGTLPMQNDRAAHSVSPDGRSQDFSNLVIADGSVFPALPAKNLTFTLMANATRIARATL